MARRADLTPEALRLIRTTAADIHKSSKVGLDRAMEWVQGEGVDAILAGREPTPLRESAAAPTTGRRENTPTAFDQLRDAVDRLRTEAQADPAADPAYVEVLEDFEVLSYALRRLGPRSYQRAVIELASRYLRERGTDDTAYQAG